MSEQKIKVDVDNSHLGTGLIMIILAMLLWSGDPDIAESLRVMAAKMAGIDPFPVQVDE